MLTVLSTGSATHQNDEPGSRMEWAVEIIPEQGDQFVCGQDARLGLDERDHVVKCISNFEQRPAAVEVLVKFSVPQRGRRLNGMIVHSDSGNRHLLFGENGLWRVAAAIELEQDIRAAEQVLGLQRVALRVLGHQWTAG